MVSKEAIITARLAINNGEEVGLQRIADFMCEAITPERLYKEAGCCSYSALFITADK